MRVPTSRWFRGGLTGLVAAGLLALAVALVVVHAGLPLHLHHGTTAGLYNEEHVLAALDSVTGDAPLPAEVPKVGLDLAPTKAPILAGVRSDARVARSADSRAPPLA